MMAHDETSAAWPELTWGGEPLDPGSPDDDCSHGLRAFVQE
jgi:hypothetical protein